mgnify:CR=1 FL=1
MNEKHPNYAAIQSWPDLSIVQRWFHSVVTHPDGVEAGVESPEASQLVPLTRGELEVMITRSERVSARDRIAIYANAYYARLLECMGESYPVLKLTLGEEAFNGLAFGYLQHYPSRSYTLGLLGDRFADYLNETRPDKTEGAIFDGERVPAWPDFLIDLAKLEWTIALVYDGPGIEETPTLSKEQISRITAESWPHVGLRTVPCLNLLSLNFPLNTYYTEARHAADDTVAPLPAAQKCYMAITRRDYVVRRHDLTRLQYLLLRALQDGATLDEAIVNATSDTALSEEALVAELTQSFSNWTRMQFFETVVYP